LEVKNTQTHTEGPSVDLHLRATAGGSDPGVIALDVVPFENYALGEEHARGGLGRIIRAHDKRLDRPVAVKEILSGGQQAARRFVREARLTARLQHPSIVPVHEAGRWPTGEPFYTMKLISGRSLKEIIDERQTLDERLALVPNALAVCEAIAYAHSRRVIHRDIKPSNVLIGEFGETVVVDWGLAKDLADAAEEIEPQAGPYRSAADAGLTVAGHVMGTPAYMPPEQAHGHPVDERADVYALGALLYHVLAGAPPYTATSSAEVISLVTQGPPPRLALRQPGVPRDLATIVDKAMARDPGRRYPSAKELSEDLRRFQTGQLITAREYSLWSLLARWTRQHAAPVAVGLTALLLLAGTGVISVRRIVREKHIADEQRNVAAIQRNAAEARANELILTQAQGWLDRDPTTAMAWLKTYPAAGEHQAAARDIARDAVSRGVAAHVLRGHHDTVFSAGFSPDGKLVVTGSVDKKVRVWDAATGKLLTVLGDADEHVHAFQFSDDGKWLLAFGTGETILITDLHGTTRRLRDAGSSVDVAYLLPHSHVLLSWGSDLTVRRWDLDAKEPQGVVIAHHNGFTANLSSDGTMLALARMDGAVELVDTTTGATRVLASTGGPNIVIMFSPDGHWIAGAGRDGKVRLWDVKSGASRAFVGHTGSVTAVHFAPDGHHLASGGADRTVRIWDIDTGTSRTLLGHQDGVNDVAFSPSGALLASAGSDRSVLVWEVATGDSHALLGHTGAIRTVSFSADGRMLASAAEDRSARVWRITDGGEDVLANSSAFAGHAVFSADGQQVVIGTADGKIQVWDLRTHESRLLRGHTGTVTRVILLPDGKQMLSSSWDSTVRLWDLEAGTSRELARQVGIVWMIALSPDGKSVASSDDSGNIRITDLATGAARELTGHKGAATFIAYSPDGKQLASASSDHSVLLWDLATGTSRLVTTFDEAACCVAFSADGRWLGSAGQDGSVRMSSFAGGGGETRLWRGHTGRVRAIAFSPDGKWLASAGEDTDVRLWEVATGAVQVHHGHSDPVRRLAFSPAGGLLASASDDRTVRLWDIASGESEILRAHQNGVLYVNFNPRGDRLVSTASDGTTRLWRIGQRASMEPLRPWLDVQTSESPAETPTR